jgi:hypothetical protein
MARRIFKITKVNLTKDMVGEDREQLELKFMEVEGYRKLAVEKARIAASHQADAQIASAQATKALADFLSLAGSHSNLVATEISWLPPYRNNEGDIVIECPMTMREQRAAVRVAKSQMNRQADEDIDMDDVFEDTDED